MASQMWNGLMAQGTKCPKCGNPMSLVHAVPKFGGLPDLDSLRCYFCNEVLTVAAAGKDAAQIDFGLASSPDDGKSCQRALPGRSR